MATLLAKCKECGRSFPAGESGGGAFSLGPPGSSVYVGSMQISGGRVALKGTEIDPCPWCRGTGRVPDGVYDIVQQGVAVFRRLARADQDRLTNVLEGLKQDERPTSPAVHDVLAGVPSEARNFLSPLLKSDKWKFWVTIFIAVLAIVVQHLDARRAIDQAHRDAQEQIDETRAEGEASEEQLHAEISRLIEAVANGQEPVVSDQEPASSKPVQPRKVGRNEPCWCGSNQKSKYCHGK